MDIKQLKDMGAFVSDSPIKKEVTWTNGKKKHAFEVFVKASSFSDIELRMLADESKSKAALTISQSILDADGNPVFTYEEAARLKNTFTRALLSAIKDVNDSAEAEVAKN